MTGDLIRNKIADRFTRTASQSAATKSIKPKKADKTTIKLKKNVWPLFVDGVQLPQG